jgi:hypothetical protein
VAYHRRVTRIAALVIWLTGCGFSSRAAPDGGMEGRDSMAVVDAEIDADLPKDGAGMGCAPGFLDLCLQAPPTTDLDITDAQTLNTDTDPRCRTYPQAGGGPVCLVSVSNAAISDAGSLTVTGSRPLAIASTSLITLAGTIDVGSHDSQIGPAADDGACSFAFAPDLDLGGGGGAAGGTFTQVGGDGGVGDSDSSLGGDGTALPGTHGPVTTITTVLRGGCAGQNGGAERAGGGNGGRGGRSGGALYLYASQSITISGSIRATGARGEGGEAQAGGGGGGSGGLVVIESASITITGQLSANGGGGGQGGARVGFILLQRDVTGRPGADGALGATPALGGFGANNDDAVLSSGGSGGAGSIAAAAGTSSIVGGGGGGGAAGAIHLLGTTAVGGSTISPPPS